MLFCTIWTSCVVVEFSFFHVFGDVLLCVFCVLGIFHFMCVIVELRIDLKGLTINMTHYLTVLHHVMKMGGRAEKIPTTGINIDC